MAGAGTLLGVATLAAVTGIWAVYYLRTPDIWTYRYRCVNGRDHIGPVLEIGWTLLAGGALLMGATMIFPMTADRLVQDHLGSPPVLVLAATVALVVLVHNAVFGSKDLVALVDRDTTALGLVPDEPRERIKSATADWNEEKRREEHLKVRFTYVVYWVPSLINIYLLVALAALIVVGLSDDLGAAFSANSAIERAEPASLGSVAAAHQSLENQYASFRDYQSAMLDLAIDVTWLLATVLVLGFWVFATGFQQIFTAFTVSLIRWVTVIVLFVFPVFIVVCYLNLVLVSNDISSATSGIVDRAHELGPSLEELTGIHEIEDRIKSVSAIETFWAKVVSSTGGVLLALGAAITLFQRRRTKQSWLRVVLPKPIQNLRSRDDPNETSWLHALLTPPSEQPPASDSMG